eukprot:TRINITY_DN122580_c0_g1_i1.p1 TRINITY_DN122580_c0_g1~~TRINITY_DN122580_c0_g1_i1.p1  ORF type:complete len:130 (+),score=7.53 TRINITY_DN122580_c0_g1_i1:43-390(+)
MGRQKKWALAPGKIYELVPGQQSLRSSFLSQSASQERQDSQGEEQVPRTALQQSTQPASKDAHMQDSQAVELTQACSQASQDRSAGVATSAWLRQLWTHGVGSSATIANAFSCRD